ncbi:MULTISPECIES: DUF6454 family protein [Kosmotoga]|uniref:Uncharacterized protein n=1 Tax=Kosmotoga olearia (strain ATCC BAA-1733 / DSM 21960 / TBF 19.5.1) TaxID=521045 RepID=C5CH23_KOSOT|nr:MULTISPECIES: DUF6454 family protein [Kosmotoga]ACR79688.1 hypothetical protein Kole_0980 [Kosmotoga olearia TBF 19.5.1]MDK2953877.1 hypothetical protein [Kosmotoga sp.]OAA21927.1 hypothetical protein DU53_05200 [Kosmotoga sp. DU53]
MSRGSDSSLGFPILSASNLKPLGNVELPFITYHVQGLAVTDEHYYLSSVDEIHNKGWLWKIDRSSLEIVKVLDLTNENAIGELTIHVGGIYHDGNYLWAPAAGYRRESPTIIFKIDPETMEIADKINFGDHIGAVASNGKDRLYLANWDSLYIYITDLSGKVIKKILNPGITQKMGYICAYQDIHYDFESGLLLCNGDTRKPYKDPDGYIFGYPYFHGYDDIFGMVDWLDLETGKVVKRVETGFTSCKTDRNTLSREGFSYHKDVMYFAPEDNITTIYMFKLISPTEPYIP